MNSSVKFKCFNKTIMLLTKHVYEELIDSLFARRSNTHLRTELPAPLTEGGKINSIKNTDRKANYK